MIKRSLFVIFLFSLYMFTTRTLVSGEPEPELEPEKPADSGDHSDKDSSESAAEKLAKTGSNVGDDDFIHGFLAALSVIIVSELGDKTFFIAAIM